jgi:hypothetical protein
MDEDHKREAGDLLAGRLAEMRTFLAFDGDPDDGPEELGPVYDYGLEWTKAVTDHIAETVTYRHVLSTGGPHEQFDVTFGERGVVDAVTFVYLPWFGRVEIELSGDDAETAREFYWTFFGDLVTEAEL